MHRLGRVLGRRIHSDELKRLVSSRHELMLSACRDDDNVACGDFLLLACYGGETFARCEYQDLVYRVDLIAWDRTLVRLHDNSAG